MLCISEASNSSEKTVNTKSFSFRMKKRKVVDVGVPCFCLHPYNFVSAICYTIVATLRENLG
jgi:hypothetical protein